MDGTITLENTRFTECIELNPEGSVFLGYLYGVLTVAGILDDGEDLKIGMPNLKVRITVAGAPRIEFPADLKEIKGVERWVAQYFTENKASREMVTRLAFALPAVGRAVERAVRRADAATG